MGKPVLDPDDDDGGAIETRVSGGDDGGGGDGGGDDGGASNTTQGEDRGDVVDPDAAGGDGAGGEGGAAGGDGDGGGGQGDALDPDALRSVAEGGDTIPRARFNEVNTELQAEREARLRAEGALAERRAIAGGEGEGGEGGGAAKPVDLKELNRQYRTKLMEGDEDAADAIMDQIQAETLARATDAADQRAIARENARLLNVAASEVVAEFPFLDSKNAKTLNKAAVAEVVEWRDFYMAKGEAPDVALRKAAKKVGPLYAPNGKGDDDGDGRPDPNAQRTANSAKKAAVAAGAQAPRTPTAGGGRTTRTTEVDVAGMSENAFRNMSEEDKRKERGDVVSG
jgi:hypothetical protein